MLNRPTRRGLLTGIGLALFAAPAIIKTPGLLMPIRPFDPSPSHILVSIESSIDGKTWVRHYSYPADFMAFEWLKIPDADLRGIAKTAEIKGGYHHLLNGRYSVHSDGRVEHA